MADRKELFIRTDMNEIIATGHVMRCLSIADAAADMGVCPVFILADENAVPLIHGRGYETIVLETAWNCMEEELPALLKLVEERHIKAMLIDSYSVTYEYLARVSENVRVTYIDDVDAFEYPVEQIVCYANYFKKMSYGAKKLLLGCDYVPLRREFADMPAKVISGEVRRILLLSGGSDPYHVMRNLTAALDASLRAHSHRDDAVNGSQSRTVSCAAVKGDRCDGVAHECCIDVICGRYNADYEYMMKKYSGSRYINIISHTDNIIEYMKSADIAISAGGTTLYELCAVGTPTITYSFADNQVDGVVQFEKDGLMPYAGDARNADVSAATLDLVEKIRPREERLRISKQLQQLVDGCGARRIVKEMSE